MMHSDVIGKLSSLLETISVIAHPVYLPCSSVEALKTFEVLIPRCLKDFQPTSRQLLRQMWTIDQRNIVGLVLDITCLSIGIWNLNSKFTKSMFVNILSVRYCYWELVGTSIKEPAFSIRVMWRRFKMSPKS